eukprot:scaffold735_cov255-Pinguiococcus_pyrenoidosus.AAC.9
MEHGLVVDQGRGSQRLCELIPDLAHCSFLVGFDASSRRQQGQLPKPGLLAVARFRNIHLWQGKHRWLGRARLACCVDRARILLEEQLDAVGHNLRVSKPSPHGSGRTRLAHLKRLVSGHDGVSEASPLLRGEIVARHEIRKLRIRLQLL